jgi:hypothetical protein
VTRRAFVLLFVLSCVLPFVLPFAHALCRTGRIAACRAGLRPEAGADISTPTELIS